MDYMNIAIDQFNFLMNPNISTDNISDQFEFECEL